MPLMQEADDGAIERVLRTIHAGKAPSRNALTRAIMSPGFNDCTELRGYLADCLSVAWGMETLH